MNIAAEPATPTPTPTPFGGGRESSFTELINTGGDGGAAELLPLIYEELGAVARRAMSSERSDHTLNPTALVHEAYLKLSRNRRVPWQNRHHFFAAAAESMRRILIDHARARACSPARKPVRLSNIENALSLSTVDFPEMMRFDEAYTRFQGAWPEAAEVLRLRLFAGLSVAQVADVLGISKSSVDRRWAFARAWMFKQLSEQGNDDGQQEQP